MTDPQLLKVLLYSAGGQAFSDTRKDTTSAVVAGALEVDEAARLPLHCFGVPNRGRTRRCGGVATEGF